MSAATVKDLAAAMDRLAPERHAEDWDNVGLLVGDPAAAVRRVALCIDYTSAVAGEVRRAGCQAVIAYHPPIFKPLKRLTPAASPVVYAAARDGVAIYSPHTALDVADGGTNDVLADVLGMTDRRPIKPLTGGAATKLVTFVPEADAKRVADALHDAGGGVIGGYDRCAFYTGGTGTFRGGEGTSPTIGEIGETESVAEQRVEMIVRADRLTAVLAALREAHPYEEPATDLIPITAAPPPGGLGRVGRVAADRAELIDRVKAGLNLDHLLIAGPTTGPAKHAACCAGSCGDLLYQATGLGATFYLTGELRHHDALAAATAGVTVICTLHSNSERKTLAVVADRLRGMLDVRTHLCASDRDPFVIA